MVGTSKYSPEQRQFIVSMKGVGYSPEEIVKEFNSRWKGGVKGTGVPLTVLGVKYVCNKDNSDHPDLLVNTKYSETAQKSPPNPKARPYTSRSSLARLKQTTSLPVQGWLFSPPKNKGRPVKAHPLAVRENRPSTGPQQLKTSPPAQRMQYKHPTHQTKSTPKMSTTPHFPTTQWNYQTSPLVSCYQTPSTNQWSFQTSPSAPSLPPWSPASMNWMAQQNTSTTPAPQYNTSTSTNWMNQPNTFTLPSLTSQFNPPPFPMDWFDKLPPITALTDPSIPNHLSIASPEPGFTALPPFDLDGLIKETTPTAQEKSLVQVREQLQEQGRMPAPTPNSVRPPPQPQMQLQQVQTPKRQRSPPIRQPQRASKKVKMYKVANLT